MSKVVFTLTESQKQAALDYRKKAMEEKTYLKSLFDRVTGCDTTPDLMGHNQKELEDQMNQKELIINACDDLLNAISPLSREEGNVERRLDELHEELRTKKEEKYKIERIKYKVLDLLK